MVNSSNSRSPILLDTPERPTGAGGNTVIEIPDSGERNPTRRRRFDSVDDVIVADSPKRARVDVPVPVIDLTADNEEESSTTDINTERLISSMQNSPRYAELRARLLPDETRLRIRRAISLRNRSTSHHSRHQLEDQSNLHAVMHARAQSMYNNLFGENSGSTILVDDDEAPSTGVPNLYDLASEYSPPSCSRVSPPRISNTTTVSARPTLSTAHRTDRNRPLTHSSLHSQDSVDSESERLGRNSRRDTSYQVRSARRHLRRQRELRERFAYISPFTNYSTNSDDNFERSAQPTEQQAAGINHDEAVPSTFNEAPPERMIRRTPPAFPMEGQLRPYDIPDLLLPAVLQSWWGPDSRLRHFGDADDDREDYEALWSLTERLGQVKPKGLSKADMGEIPAFRYSAASKDSSNGSCVVCMMNYSNREKLRRLPCNHDFHAKCIDRWLKNNRSCPVCRKDVITN